MVNGLRAPGRRANRERFWRGEEGMQESEAGPPPLWRATVPVFLAVLDRMEAELAQAEARLGDAMAAALAQRPSPGMMPAERQVATAVQLTLRIAFPLAGERRWGLRGPLDGPGLRARLAAAREHLAGLDPAAFAGAEGRTVTAQAGFADAGAAGGGVPAPSSGCRTSTSTRRWRTWR